MTTSRHPGPGSPAASGSHHAFFCDFCDGDDGYAAALGSFLREGLAAGEPALVAVPGSRLPAVRASLADSPLLSYLDIADLGRNPARIIPAIHEFTGAFPGRRTRFASEPIWPGRTPAETVEVTRHEALLNLAFPRVPLTMCCLYDTSSLPAAVLADAARTHAYIRRRDEGEESRTYTGPALADEITSQPPPSPPPDADELRFQRGDLRTVRRHIRARATRAGLERDRAEDLMMAVNELATNTIIHTRAPATLRTWEEPGTLICEVTGPGRIADPLAGRRPPTAHLTGETGLWLVNQLCDLTDLHTGSWGTIIRLHMRTGTAPAS